VLPLPPAVSMDEEIMVEPELILESRYTPSGHLEVLVQWVGLPITAATWVDVKEFRAQFPSYQLEGKLSVKGGGIDRLDRVYVRKTREKEAVGV